jgi:hypothetical protein
VHRYCKVKFLVHRSKRVRPVEKGRDFRADARAFRVILGGFKGVGDRLDDRQGLAETVEHLVQVGSDFRRFKGRFGPEFCGRMSSRAIAA